MYDPARLESEEWDVSEKLKTAVIGAGHFGRYHAQKYAALEDCELVGVVDVDRAAAEKLAQETAGQGFGELTDVIDKVDAVSIAVPTRAHFEVAAACLEHGLHVLLEKPITGDVDSAEKLIALADAQAVKFQIGHLERFSPAFELISERVHDPLYIEAHRVAIYQPRGTDVNVVLDIMIHDIDMILALVAAPVVSVDAVGAPVVSEQEDIVNTRIRFANGAAANVTASRVSLKTKRKIRIFQPDQYLQADLVERRLVCRRRGEGELFPGIPNITEEELEIPDGDSLMREVRSFVEAIREDRPVAVTGVDGLNAVQVADMIQESLRENRAAVVSPEALRVLNALD